MELRFDKDGLIQVVVQDVNTKDVLMSGSMNPEALAKTMSTGQVTFWTRSCQKLWTKGETSGNFLNLVRIQVNCNSNSLLIWVEPVGNTCHTGAKSCYLNPDGGERLLENWTWTSPVRFRRKEEGK